jgi:ABC-type enterochelin transport system permease subunit
MEKRTNKVHDCHFSSTTDPRIARPRSEIFIDLGCGAALWVCGAALSTIQLALQEPSHNAVLRVWQDVSSNNGNVWTKPLTNQLVASPIQQSISTALIGSIAFCTVGYATACIYTYSRAPSLVAFATAACIALVFIEGLWNGLRVTLIERLAVVMPTAVNIGLTWVLLRRRSTCQNLAVRAPCAAV